MSFKLVYSDPPKTHLKYMPKDTFKYFIFMKHLNTFSSVYRYYGSISSILK